MSRLKKHLQNAGFFFLMRERERWVIKRTIDFWALQLHSMTPFKKSSRVGARKIHFFLLCTIILYHFDILGVNLSKKVNCFLCPINPVEWKKQIQNWTLFRMKRIGAFWFRLPARRAHLTNGTIRIITIRISMQNHPNASHNMP